MSVVDVETKTSDADGWARAGTFGKWHKVYHDHRTDTFRLACSGRTHVAEGGKLVFDYRIQPGDVCKHPACQLPFED